MDMSSGESGDWAAGLSKGVRGCDKGMTKMTAPLVIRERESWRRQGRQPHRCVSEWRGSNESPPPTNHPLLLFTTVTESTGDNVCTACRGIGVKPPKSLALLSGITVVATGWENVKLWHSERQQKMRPESFEEALCLLYQLSIQIWTDERKTGRIIRHWIHLKWTHFLNLCKGWG